jgi:hypothetical protein
VRDMDIVLKGRPFQLWERWSDQQHLSGTNTTTCLCCTSRSYWGSSFPKSTRTFSVVHFEYTMECFKNTGTKM